MASYARLRARFCSGAGRGNDVRTELQIGNEGVAGFAETVLWEMLQILIDGTFRQGHQAGIGERAEFGGEIAGFYDDDFEGFGLKV